MEHLYAFQDYAVYKDEDHGTWKELNSRQSGMRGASISDEYLKGFEQLALSDHRIVNIAELSERMAAISGWTLVPVHGLIPTRDFFYMLINKRYPVTVSIRKPWEIDFAEQPDIFHDVYGHLPLLTNEKFYRFLTAYSIIALKYVNNERAVEFLGRLYWYTYEMGVIRENGKLKPYGGAIITSREEMDNLANPAIPKHEFDVEKIFETPYNPFKLQNEYFIINSFDDLFNSLEDLETKLIAHLLLPEHDQALHNYSLNPRLSKGYNNVIGFLNDTQFRFPDAISFVAGQPDEQFFEIQDHLDKFDLYVDYLCAKQGTTDRKKVINKIGQYNKTKGIANEIIAEQLRKDENIHLTADNLLVTVGAQEAFAVIVSTICDRGKDVILVEDPSYIGLSNFCKIFDYDLEGVPVDEEGIGLAALKKKIMEVNSSGKRVKLLYVIPDYQNPTGACMPIGSRLKLLELANKYNFLIIEDSVYNSFTYLQKKHPTLKSLDRYQRVIYVGSYAKSLFPGLRIGLIGADQKIENEAGNIVPLIDEMVKVKAQITNNTPTINQAILAGVLLDLDCSLHEWNRKKFESYKYKRDVLLYALDRHIAAYRHEWSGQITWNSPDGGFFMKITLPFDVGDEDVVSCAENFGVMFSPMRYFYLKSGGLNEIRITFSNLSPQEIETGIERLARYFRTRIGQLNAEEKKTALQYH